MAIWESSDFIPNLVVGGFIAFGLLFVLGLLVLVLFRIQKIPWQVKLATTVFPRRRSLALLVPDSVGYQPFSAE